MFTKAFLRTILAITMVCSLSIAADFDDTSAYTDTIKFYGPLSEIYDGIDSRFFESTDTVDVFFIGELLDGKMYSGFAEIESANQHVYYLGNIEFGTMRGEEVQVTWVKPDETANFYSGKFNGYEFDSCFFANSGDSIVYIGKMEDSKFHDDDATYVGPLHHIYDGDISTFTNESMFLNYSHIYFDNGDTATYRGTMRYGHVAGNGNLMLQHDEDTLLYSGEFENAQIHGIGMLKVGNHYSYRGHFAEGQIAGMGEMISDNFSSIFTENELIPGRYGELTIKGLWNGNSGLSEYFRVSAEDGETIKLRVDDGEIKELSLLQKIGQKVSESRIAEILEEYNEEFQMYITGAAILNAGVCVSALVPQITPVAGPICGIGFFGITGIEAAKLTILTFRNIDKQCYTDDCVEDTWFDYGKHQLVNVALVGLPFAIGEIGKVAAPAIKGYANTFKMGKYAKAVANSKNAAIVAELENLPKITITPVERINIVNDHLALKQAVLDHTGKNFREGFVEFFIRLKNSGREDLIEEIWNSHKNYIKNSGIRTGNMHEWLEAENFVKFLIDPKWGKDGAYLAYSLTKMTQPTTEIILKNGGAHTIINEAGLKIPGPNSGRFHRDLGKEIAKCNNAGCVFNNLNEFAKQELTKQSYESYTYMERAILQ